MARELLVRLGVVFEKDGVEVPDYETENYEPSELELESLEGLAEDEDE